MRKVLLAVLVLLMAVGVAFAAKATQKDAMDLANKAAAFLKANGDQKAFAEFNKKDGKFTDMSKDLYIYVLDLNAKCLAHGASAALIGKDLSQIKDTDGKLFIAELVKNAKAKGKGWAPDYKWTNPTSKKIEVKSTYFVKVGDRIVCCGIYK